MHLLVVTGLILEILSCALAQLQRFIVGIAGVMHESNSFNPAKTVISDFEGMRGTTTLSGPELLASLKQGNSEISGYLDGAESEHFEVYAGYVASATPKGPLTKDTFETVTQRMIASLKAAPKLDGILLALHGAMVADGYPQADEEIVRRVKAAFGTAIPIVVTHDFHGNPSPEIVRLSTALVGYQQNPHLDTRLRGRRAASIMARTLRGEIKPVQGLLSRQWCTTSSSKTPTQSRSCPSRKRR